MGVSVQRKVVSKGGRKRKKKKKRKVDWSIGRVYRYVPSSSSATISTGSCSLPLLRPLFDAAIASGVSDLAWYLPTYTVQRKGTGLDISSQNQA